MKTTSRFLTDHKLGSAYIDIKSLVDSITTDMVNGLKGWGDLRMIPTYISADNTFTTGVNVLAIDAGGTNFRAALLKFSNNGDMEVLDQIKAIMPGTDGPVSGEEFFRKMAEIIRPLAERSDRIGFCFSYPTEILPDKDGILLQFTKEVQAPGVVGQKVGKSLLGALGMPGKPIVVLNDTVATLLAGKSMSFGRDYDTYIGFILGTGTNTCYSEQNVNILKIKGLEPSGSQIINIESGNIRNLPRTDIDIYFDNTTNNPGNYVIEKMISGGYLGGLSLEVLKFAAREGVFSKPSADALPRLEDLSTEEMNNYLNASAAERGVLSDLIQNGHDERSVFEILEAVIDRAGKLSAAKIAATILKTGKGLSAGKPVLITIEGTTFYKLKGLKASFENHLAMFFNGGHRRYYDFAEVPQASLVGAALAALVD